MGRSGLTFMVVNVSDDPDPEEQAGLDQGEEEG
jgi:hypothetical protein